MKAESKAEDFNDFLSLADSIHKNLGDKEWATKLYMRVESMAENTNSI